MKPIRLKMKAFGSYVEDEISFDRFSGGLFLVCGETGSGKTMIFDAICFALYGTTSSTERKEYSESLHCDRVSLSEDAVTELVFEQSGRRYTVERRLHYSRTRGTNEYGRGKQEAVLKGPDGETVQGQSEVTRRCTEILGVNVDQFRKIVMLAQGEFREFLKADSGKKSEILGKLFDNRIYTRYQEILGRAKEMLEGQRKANNDKLAALLREEFPEERYTGEERALYHPDNPELAANLEKLTGGEADALAALEKERGKIQREVTALNLTRGAADRVNNDLNKLRAGEAHLKELEDRQEEITGLEETVRTVSTVLHTVKPAIDGRKAAGEALENAKKRKEELKERQKELIRILEEARKTAADDEPAAQEAEKLKSGIAVIEKQLPSYRQLKEQTEARAAAEAAAKKAAEEKAAAEEKRGKLQEELKQAGEQAVALKGIDEEVCRKAEAETAAAEALKLLTARDGIFAEVRSARNDGQALTGETEKLETLMRAAAEAEQRHHELYRRFISGQAGLLADDLRREIGEKGSAPCPVCGTVHGREGGAHFAVRPEGTPSEDEVRGAKESADKAEESRKNQERRLQKMQQAFGDRKNDIMRKAYPLIPGCTWEQISADEFMESAEKDFREKAAAAGSSLEAAKAKQKERDGLLRRIEEIRQDAEETGSRITALTGEESRQNGLFAGAESAIRDLREQLGFESAEAAEKQQKEWTARLTALQAEITRHAEAEKKAAGDCERVRGDLEGREKELPGLEEACARAEEAMRKALTEHGFETPEAALAALAPLEGRDGERWLDEKRKVLHDYANDRENTERLILELKESTKGKAYTDLEELDAQIGEKNERHEALIRQCTEASGILERHRETLRKARDLKASLSSTDNAYRRLSQLAALAVGSNAEGGKVSFDRYVMGAAFREILEMANRRLDVMSGGQYELRHITGALRASSKAGLELEVMDTFIGKARPSALLSGGEGFYASLALALGVSDVVRNHAGGIQLDSLFIDEGFGTLSPDVLDKALEVLNQLTEGDRLVGIISHVDKLDESIPQKIRVVKDDHGSHAQIHFS